jgi:23S rRNA pseudouridine1911/1915/1917 synthase
MSRRSIRLDVPDEAAGVRLDAFLAAHHPGTSRSVWKRFIEDGRVAVDGRPAAKPGFPLKSGMTIEATIPEAAPTRLEGEDIPIAFVFEDEHLAVVMKPAGLVVHPGHGARHGTLVHALLGRGLKLAPAGGAERPGIVHRLDKDTSGLLVIAKTDAAHSRLAAMFARRTIAKTYLALVWGRPRPPAGRIDDAIGRSRRDPTKMTVRAPRSREATTIYRTLEVLPSATRVEIDLVTGRTHQIRVHFAARRHPVIGDTRYGGAPWKLLRDPERRKLFASFSRLALHATTLAFTHPVTGEPMLFSAPLPDDVVALVDALRRGP